MEARAGSALSPPGIVARALSTFTLRLSLEDRGLAAVAAGFTLVSGLAMFVVSPRFGLDHLSAVDDWAGYSKSPEALERLVRLSYDPAAVGDAQRYRPAFTAVWNGLVWHTLGAPGSLVGPNIWNAFRILLFVGAAMALVLAALPRTSRLAVRVTLAAALPTLVLATPAVGRDFARLGPAEPLLLGGMIAGALLLALGTGRWLAGAAGRYVAPPLVAGYALWLLGVYQKETSACFLVAAPFVCLFLDRRWRTAGTIERPLLSYWRFRLVATAVLLPVVHMAAEVWRLAATGTVVYGERVPHGPAGVADRLIRGTATEWRRMTVTLGSPLWAALALLVIVLAARALWRRSTVDWLVVALVATGWSVLAFEGLSGAHTVSRYYLPAITLFGAASAIALASSTRRIQRSALAAGTVLFLLGGSVSYWGVRVWATNEREDAALVERVAELNPRGCPVYLGRADNELAHALPVLIALDRDAGTACFRGADAVLVARRGPKPYDSFKQVTDDRIFAACLAPGWSTIARTRHFQLLSCRRLTRREIRGESIETVLARDRLTTRN